MSPASSETEILLDHAQSGDEAALGALFDRYRERLRRMIRLRLDRRLAGQVSSDRILQEAYRESCRRFPEFVRDPTLPVFLWFRRVTGEVLKQVHRAHLGSQVRDAGQEVSLLRGALPPANSASLAAQFLGTITHVAQAALRAEHKLIVQETLNSMDPLDREVLTLRHFEQLNNDETALVLGLSKGAASNHYLRALRRIKEVLASLPGPRAPF